MALYCGLDLHSNNHVVVVIDEQDRRLIEKRLPNDLGETLRILSPLREQSSGVAIESRFNWYWLADGLMEADYPVLLVNTAAVKKYEGLKHADDPHDAFWRWLRGTFSRPKCRV
jgi:transposase